MTESNLTGIGIGFGIERSDKGVGNKKLNFYRTTIEYIGRDSIPKANH